MKLNLKDLLIKKVGIEHNGGNFVLDKGLPYGIYSSYMDSFHNYIRMVKLGWTTTLLFSENELQKKIEKSKGYGLPLCLGGTLFEISHKEGYFEEFLNFAKILKIDSVEIASGFTANYLELPQAIRKAKQMDFDVLVEIGYKDQTMDEKLEISERIKHIKSAIDAGADKIVLEAREVGAGYSVFSKDKNKNEELLDRILSFIGLDKIVFEAPTRNEQVPLINKLGSDVNLGNIPFDEIPRVETFRRRLHADTYKKGS